MEKTTIQISEDLRKNLKILASFRDISYEDVLEDFIEMFYSIIPFKGEDEFSKWFERNLVYFGFSKIVEKRKGFPDYLVEDKKGKKIKIELELIATDFIRHKHDPKRVDLIICVFSDRKEIDGVPVISIVETPISVSDIIGRRQRVSLSLDSEMIKSIDQYVKKIKARSRSEAIETIIQDYLEKRKTCVILAGGNPKKLYINELKTYRPLVKIGEVTLIEDIIMKVRNEGYTNVIIVGFSEILSEIRRVLENGDKYEVKIIYVNEKKELGSAKTLELAKKYLKGDFLFLPCDHYFDFELKKIYDIHQSFGGLSTLGVFAGTSFDWHTSFVEMEGAKIVDYEEFPKNPKTHVISVFIGFMNDTIFNLIPTGEKYFSIQENIFPKLAKEGKLFGCFVNKNWINVHSKKDVEKIIKLKKITE